MERKLFVVGVCADGVGKMQERPVRFGESHVFFVGVHMYKYIIYYVVHNCKREVVRGL